MQKLYDKLWETADELRANSKLRPNQYSTPVLGIIFLRYADHRFEQTKKELEKKFRDPRALDKRRFQRAGTLYLTEKARYQYLLNLPESEDIGGAIDEAMRSIEKENIDLKDVLPKTYSGMEKRILFALLKNFSIIPTELDRDIFGKIYEYFLGQFATDEGTRGGEFYTPTSIVRLIVEILEPYKGKILDPACGSGGMFVQSAEFVRAHKLEPTKEISLYGQELADQTVRLCKMNLAVHGLPADIKQGNTYYQDAFNMVGEFDYVMANPPFNVNNVDKAEIADDPRYDSIPNVDNANYLWIQIFHTMINETGRAGFVMANSASDSRYSEQEIRKKIIEKGDVDVIISIASNFFYTVTLPVTLWFYDKGKKVENKNKILFIDARKIFTQIDRSHREFTEQQIEFIANIVRLYRGEEPETNKCSSIMLKEHFPDMKYKNIKGLCNVVSVEELGGQDWSLNPSRYVGIELDYVDKETFLKQIKKLYEEMMMLNIEANNLEIKISNILEKLMESI
ncbi:MAG: type I restriction-modification system subunit M [Candidatus Heimdallarchaeaceae archaeon]